MCKKAFAVAAVFLTAATAAGCGSTDSAQSCKAAADCGNSEDCVNGACAAYAVCPADIEATFASIQAGVLSKSCGTSEEGCHSARGGPDSGGLDLATDPYAALLGPNGQGAPAENIEGTTKSLLRVVPGEPDNSFLVIKLRLKANDARYGHGMPYPSPGSVCPTTLAAIRSWIQGGAKQ